MKRAGALAWPAALLILTGCAGGAPLLHPAQVLKPYEVMAGAGLSGQLAVKAGIAHTQAQQDLQNLDVAPGVAPWFSGRVGLPASNEIGATLSGRSLRVDARHGFDISSRMALSLGVGGTALVGYPTPSGTPGDGYNTAAHLAGGGFDVPVLFGLHSASDLYSLWFGPRGGVDFTSVTARNSLLVAEASSKHYYGGLVAGFRAGFRHVHVAGEVDVNYHHNDGTVMYADSAGKLGSPNSGNLDQLTVTPAGALEITF